MAVKDRSNAPAPRGHMARVSAAASRRAVHPTRIIYTIDGLVLRYERRTAEELIAAGLIKPEEIPERRAKESCRGRLRVDRNRDGSLNVRIDADEMLSRDKGFKRFLGGLLADTRLSLVQDEDDEPSAVE